MECIKDIKDYKNKTIKLSGWIYNYRSSGKISFLQLRDGTGFIQCVAIKNNLSEAQWNDVDKITQETSVEINGLVKEDVRSDIGFEIEITEIKILQIPEEEYIIDICGLDLKNNGLYKKLEILLLMQHTNILKKIILQK
jgi:asparaginyl-tRNA synthetase